MNAGPIITALALALLIAISTVIGCATGGSGSTIGFFPVELTGSASAVVGCDALGLSEDDDVLIALTGNRIRVDTDDFDFDCRGTIFGGAEITFADADDPAVDGVDFEITAKDGCGDLDDLDWTDLRKVRVMFETLPPDTPLTCTDASDAPAGDRLECAIDACTFTIADPLIVYQFDLEYALEEAIYDALY